MPTKADLNELKSMVDIIIQAPNKSEAKSRRSQAESFAHRFNELMDPYEKGKLREAFGYAYEASGRTDEKEHWAYQMRNSWYVFETSLKNKVS